jgi:hypothetical protein
VPDGAIALRLPPVQDGPVLPAPPAAADTDLPPARVLPGLDRPRPAVLLGLGTTVVALVVLSLPAPALGWRILAIVVAFHATLLGLARAWGLPGWRTSWTVLAPLSVLMVLPDWFLSAVLGTLFFPDTGAPFVGTVPVFMAGMWTMALFPLVVLGAAVESRRGSRAALLAVAVAGLALFAAAERVAPLVPIWEPVDVATVAGVAWYVLPAEVVLAVAAWLLVRGRRPAAWTALGVLALPFLYTGLAATGYQLLG